jgi:hypothetical protein
MLRLLILSLLLLLTLVVNVVGVAMRQDEYDDLVDFLKGINVPSFTITGS